MGTGQASAPPDGNYLHRQDRYSLFLSIPTNSLDFGGPVKARMLSAALVALVALVVAGCGGASDTKNATASGGGGGAKLSLVAYSTPPGGFHEAPPEVGATPHGKGTAVRSAF